ncbi:MAG: gliding motility-associated ABC transporter substrate-binding protein GldG [Chitinophagaceae bacterium]
MQKLLSSKYWWIFLLLILAGINYLASQFHYRIDFTQEHRYTLSKTTRQLLGNLQDEVQIDVFLKGDFKSGIKKLAQGTEELLQEFQDYSHGKLVVRYINPLTDMSDSAAAALTDSLQRMGISPMTQVAQSKKGEEQTQRVVMPGAILQYNNRIYPVNLLAGVRNSDENELYTNAEALLEYKFASAIDKITQEKAPLLGYVLGNGEPLGYTAYSALTYLSSHYRMDSMNLRSVASVPAKFDALVILQPKEKFTDSDKLKLDQYIMHGGKLLIAADMLEASMDSLRARNETVAFDKGLELGDLFFKYGFRINEDLVQDMQCSNISLVVGMVGDKPQFQLFKWPYYPLLSGSLTHPISKNLDPVYSKFANSIDTIKTPDIKKTVLLSTSVNGRSISTPALISFESIKVADDPNVFNKPYIPVSLLLEGKFSSLYANRLSTAVKDSFAAVSKEPFLAAGNKEAKIIVVADGDVLLNEISEQRGPLPMGFNKDINYTFANQDFLQNCIEYLVNPSNILETRAKDFTVRLLDPRKTEDERNTWQLLNIGLPVLLVIIFGAVYQALRKRKYAK